jgi:hypothetical protein
MRIGIYAFVVLSWLITEKLSRVSKVKSVCWGKLKLRAQSLEREVQSGTIMNS